MAKPDNKLLTYEKFTNLIYYSKLLLTKYPKSERFDLCSDIKSIEYECLKDIIFAWKEFDNIKKLEALRRIDINLMVLKSLIKISYTCRYITAKNFMVWNEKVSEIGRLIGGWIKSCQNV